MFVPIFYSKTPKAAFSHQVTDRKHETEGTLTTYHQVVNYMLETYATDNVIAEAEAGITNFKQPARSTAVLDCEAVLEKALRCGMTYNGLRLKRIFVEGLDSPILLFKAYMLGSTQRSYTT